MSQQRMTIGEVVYGLDDFGNNIEVFVEVNDKRYVVTDVEGGTDKGVVIAIILAEEEKEEDE
jgi:hypothetical protein